MSDIEREFDEDFGSTEVVRDVHGQSWIPGPSPTPMLDTPSIGDQIAYEFSLDKRHLSNSERRRLASMIDSRIKREFAVDVPTSELRNKGLDRMLDDMEKLP